MQDKTVFVLTKVELTKDDQFNDIQPPRVFTDEINARLTMYSDYQSELKDNINLYGKSEVCGTCNTDCAHVDAGHGEIDWSLNKSEVE